MPLPLPCPMTGGASVAERAVEGDFVPRPFPWPVTGGDPAVMRPGEEVLVAFTMGFPPNGLDEGATRTTRGSSSRLQTGKR